MNRRLHSVLFNGRFRFAVARDHQMGVTVPTAS